MAAKAPGPMVQEVVVLGIDECVADNIAASVAKDEVAHRSCGESVGSWQGLGQELPVSLSLTTSLPALLRGIWE